MIMDQDIGFSPKRDLRLLIPKGSQRAPIHIPTATTLSHSEIFSSPGTRKELISQVKQLPYAQCILLSSKQASFLEKRGWFDTEAQLGLAKNLFDRESFKKVQGLMRSNTGQLGKRTLFHDWQLRFLVKASLIYGSPMRARLENEQKLLRRYGRCLLIINDLMIEDRPEEGYETPGDLRSGIQEALIRQVAAHRVENPKHLLARYFILFLRIASDPEILNSPNALNIRSAFFDATGIDLRTFLATGLGVYTYYLDVKDFSTRPFVIKANGFFRRSAVSGKSTKNLFSLLGTNRRIAKKEHRAKYKRGLGKLFDLINLMQRPLVQLQGGNYVPVSPQDVVERITAGVYWDIHDHLQGTEREKFQRFFGELIEAYVRLSFQRMIPESEGLVRRTYYDFPYITKDGERRASDTILFGPNYAVFVDATVGRLRMTETVIPGALDEFREDIQVKIVETARQIDRSIQDFKTGILNFPDWQPNAIQKYHPIIVTSSPLPIILQTWEEVLHLVQSAGLLTELDIKPLEILSLEDLEFIEPVVASGVTIERLLVEKQGNQDFARGPIIDFLAKHSAYKEYASKTYLSKMFSEQMEEVRHELFPE